MRESCVSKSPGMSLKPPAANYVNERSSQDKDFGYGLLADHLP